ncbi:MAG: hypothetical protein Q9184_008329, partial [Pyrenodesmia sp. 2 TL-2023]
SNFTPSPPPRPPPPLCTPAPELIQLRSYCRYRSLYPTSLPGTLNVGTPYRSNSPPSTASMTLQTKSSMVFPFHPTLRPAASKNSLSLVSQSLPSRQLPRHNVAPLEAGSQWKRPGLPRGGGGV